MRLKHLMYVTVVSAVLPPWLENYLYELFIITLKISKSGNCSKT